MAVRFILGRSGTGKTSLCVRQIVEALLAGGDEPLLFLVPEQATYQAERAILSDGGVAGFSRLNVLSFDRLQYLLSGKNTARPSISRIGRGMIVQGLIRRCADKLKVFGAAANRVGFGRQIAETIAEFCRYGRGPDELDELIGQLRKVDRAGLTAAKFADISVIFKEYLRSIEGRFVDPDFQLSLARKAVADSALVKGAKLWVDGFAGFTGAELEILAELLQSAAEANIALCLDPAPIDLKSSDLSKLDPVSAFAPTEKTYCELLYILRKVKLRIDEPVIMKEPVRFTQCPALGHVEAYFSETKAARSQGRGKVRITAAANARSEAQYTAREIVRLVRDQGYRYRDIAVIASDIEAYQHYLTAYFEQYRIPFFLDRRSPMQNHPVVQLVRSALQIVTDGFSTKQMMALLRTGLTGAPNYQIDALENYCIAFGIRSDDWKSEKPWQFAARDEKFDEELINKVRAEVAMPILKLADELAGDELTATQFNRAIFSFLQNLDTENKLSEWAEQATQAGSAEEAQRHQQFWQRFCDLFDELSEAFGSQQMNCRSFAAVLADAFSQMTLALIPPSLDQVLIGSVERSRHPDLRAVFVIGCTQRRFPVPVDSGGILTEQDRTAADSANRKVGPTLREQLSGRQYLVYIAFTRPSDYLCVSYPLIDGKGNAEVCSEYAARLTELFDDVNIEMIDSTNMQIEDVCNDGELAELLCAGLAKGENEQLEQLLDDISGDEHLKRTADDVRWALGYNNQAKLNNEVTEELFGPEIHSSATRLSTFADCPYRHFARYILKLEKRAEFRFEPLDRGRFYHLVLDRLTKELNRDKVDWATVDDERLVKVLHEQLEAVLQEESFVRNFAKHGPGNMFIIHTASERLERFVRAMAAMIRAGAFRPSVSEVQFGAKKDALGEYRLELSGEKQLILHGKIDRIDTAQVEGKPTAVVFDYKLSPRSFNWSGFYYGIDSQFAVYIPAAQGPKQNNVIGAFYIPVEVPAKRKAESNYKAKGIFDGRFIGALDKKCQTGRSNLYSFMIKKDGDVFGNYGRSDALKAEDFEKVLRFARQKVRELAEQIAAGQIGVEPYRLSSGSPCTWCDYRALCRFDWQINDYRLLESLSKNDVLEKLS